MTPQRKQRLLLLLLIVSGVGIASFFSLRAFNSNVSFFYTPTQIKAGEAPLNNALRLGGLVVEGSVKRQTGELAVYFDLSDNQESITVFFDKILPDLFREGQGIIATGKLDDSGVFRASEVLAKHDENYMPPEVAAALQAAHEAKAGFPVPETHKNPAGE